MFQKSAGHTLLCFTALYWTINCDFASKNFQFAFSKVRIKGSKIWSCGTRHYMGAIQVLIKMHANNQLFNSEI